MTAQPKTTKRGYDPEAASFPKRKCDNCGLPYKPKQKPRKGQKFGFCSQKCKWQFHKHGAAFIQLKGALEKMVETRSRDTTLRLNIAGINLSITALQDRLDSLELEFKQLVFDIGSRSEKVSVQSKTKGPKRK